CARDRGRLYGGVFNNWFDVW
nr:immunoglobulin heavy chain junction region [Macaca mulatta]MPN69634.1 immunoglobulin heavy chain junction region [Macaca mulatta]MPN69686.1 immunoglobulin heavy chain junction region [Macaca mulatta]MPN69866.1 immunoglobulin heavy chain junction region [Macaca mulatta]MPN69964.1 immunoglobulin heavy chain junction region [Macaca mulatta]